MNAPSHPESTALAVADRQQFDLSPRNFEQALTFSDYLAESDMVPKDFKGKPGNCLIAIQWGAELGLKPLQALQNLAIINGRPSLWGDAVIALVRSSPLCEYVIESDDGTAATCRVKRRGEPEQSRTFSMDDAKAAGLQGKQGPWSQYPKRMRQMRARAFALRDVFPDVLRGLPVAEEVMDIPTEKNMGAADVVGAPPPPPAADKKDALPEFTEAHLKERLVKIAEFYAKGKTAAEIVAFYSAKSTLPPAMQDRIRAMDPKASPAVDDVAPKVTYAALADRLHKCEDRDTAAVILDEGRALPADQQQDLAAIFTSKFQPQG